ncbi:MAG TPA: RNA polymerase subunit sigma-70 [Deltaproteobacteria bacterium]|nr:RNA polymerase subunit sigma-70 [Deltaproteobacteria bacterium]
MTDFKHALEPVDPLKRYIQEISAYPFLTAKEERELALAFQKTGDREAARKLVTSHLRLVVKIAAEYRTAYGNLLDLIQEGNLGLMRAVKSFDPDKGARLSHYASWWIRSFILKHILDNFRLIKIGTTQAQRRIFFNLMKEKERLEKQGFRPGTQELAAAMDVKPEEVEEMQLRLGQSDLSLDAPIHGDDERRRIDLVEVETPPIEETLDQAAFKDVLEQKLKEFSHSLNKREAKIFHERLVAEVPLTLQAIADEYGISRERARQIEERIKEKLKTFFESSGVQVEEHLG